MKRTLVLLLTGMLTIGMLSGCGLNSISTGETQETTIVEASDITEEATINTQETAVWTEETAVTDSTDSAAIDVSNDAAKNSALQIMDSLMMCMMENGCEYKPADPEFFWLSTFYAIGNYGYLREGNNQVEIDGETGIAKVYYRTVQEYSSALFEEYSDLLPIPSDMTSVYQDEEDSEIYCFMIGDRGTSASRIISWTDNGDGTYNAVVELYDVTDDTKIATGEFTLIDNPYADSITDPIFYYTVSSAKLTQ